MTEEIQSGFHPDWFHPHGARMEIAKRRSRTIILASDASRIEVSFKNNIWVVWWTVQYDKESACSGVVIFSAEELRSAFGLSELSFAASDWIKKWMADCASEGRFIRYRRFLNITGPGNGRKGDPNVSLYVTDGIRQAVSDLLDRSQRRPRLLRMEFASVFPFPHSHVIA